MHCGYNSSFFADYPQQTEISVFLYSLHHDGLLVATCEDIVFMQDV